VYKQEVNRYSTGIVSDRNRLYWDKFKQIQNIMLAEDEQRKIVAYINEQICPIELAVSRKRREILLVQEYRSRLIADVVMGWVDVREAAAKLADVPCNRCAEGLGPDIEPDLPAGEGEVFDE
jgi:type I restriction enzyme S subunit